MTALADDVMRLDELVPRESLAELCRSVYELFGIPVRIYAADSRLLGGAVRDHEVCQFINTTLPGRAACAAQIDEVRSDDGGDAGDRVHRCFSGNAYRVIAIEFEGRRLGRLVLGPYLPMDVTDVPGALVAVEPTIDRDRARALLFRVPRAKEETIARVAAHVRRVLDMSLFAGHKALLTSEVHILSVRESFRTLEEKNARLQEAYDRLRELDRLKSNFLATVSHELRTPLTSIIGYSEMLAEGLAGTLNAEQTDFAQIIRKKGEDLLGLISSLLDMSKLESGTLAVRKETLVVTDVLGEAVKTLAPVARKKGVVILYAPPLDVPEVTGDPERLRQVFINLLDNAVKFTPAAGEVTVSIEMLGSALDDSQDDDSLFGAALLAPLASRVAVSIKDTGIGIPLRERTRVFDAFYQVDSSSTREYSGTGLGLAIVKKLVESHSGTITIEDNAPRGTIFTVHLPVKAATLLAATDLAEIPRGQEGAGTPHLPDLR